MKKIKRDMSIYYLYHVEIEFKKPIDYVYFQSNEFIRDKVNKRPEFYTYIPFYNQAFFQL